MKMLLTSLLLFVGAIAGFGAVALASDEPSYNFDEETYRYDNLGLGNTANLLRFMTNQIYAIGVAVYQQNGTGGFDSRVGPYPCFHAPEYRGEETFEQAIARVSTTEFQRVSALENYKMNQRFTIWLIMYAQVGAAPQFSGSISFIPVKSEDEYVIPQAAFNSLKLERLANGDHIIWWPHIESAVGLVFDKKNRIIFDGSFGVNPGLAVMIPTKLTTNGYTGTLTITLDTGDSVLYSFHNGSIIFYPEPPAIFLAVKSGKIMITVKAGVPYREISLLCYTNLNLPPIEQVLTLNNIGSAVWTNRMHSAVGIFKVQYSRYESLKLQH